MKKIIIGISIMTFLGMVSLTFAADRPRSPNTPPVAIDKCKSVNIDDGKTCTVDKCNSSTGQITHTVACPVGAACGRSGSCEKIDKCKSANIDDGKACTSDSCNPATGQITHSIACQTGETCNATGACEKIDKCKGVAIDDGKACTADICDPATGLSVHKEACPSDAACNSNGVCQELDKCETNFVCDYDDQNNVNFALNQGHDLMGCCLLYKPMAYFSAGLYKEQISLDEFVYDYNSSGFSVFGKTADEPYNVKLFIKKNDKTTEHEFVLKDEQLTTETKNIANKLYSSLLGKIADMYSIVEKSISENKIIYVKNEHVCKDNSKIYDRFKLNIDDDIYLFEIDYPYYNCFPYGLRIFKMAKGTKVIDGIVTFAMGQVTDQIYISFDSTVLDLKKETIESIEKLFQEGHL